MKRYLKKDLKGKLPSSLYDPLPDVIVKKFDTIGLKDFSLSAFSVKAGTTFSTDWVKNALEDGDTKFVDYITLGRIGHIIEQLNGNILPSGRIRTAIKDDIGLATVFLAKTGTSAIVSYLDTLVKKAVASANYVGSYAQDYYNHTQPLLKGSEKNKVVFSTNPLDIAQMSMRGINSCMSWYSGSASSLVGSMVDPWCGIVYMTNGKKIGKVETEGGNFTMGERMMYRAVVRFCHNPIFTQGQKYFLAMERTYPTIKDDDDNYVSNEHGQSYLHAALNKKWKPKSRIIGRLISTKPEEYYTTTIVGSQEVDLMDKIHGECHGYYTYSDAELEYGVHFPLRRKRKAT